MEYAVSKMCSCFFFEAISHLIQVVLVDMSGHMDDQSDNLVRPRSSGHSLVSAVLYANLHDMLKAILDMSILIYISLNRA